MTFTSGVLLLLGWLYANIDNPRCAAILKRSALLFLLPMLFWPGSFVRHLHLGIWIAAACEEALKAYASTREQNHKNKFWLVVLFGIWELTVDKPFWGLVLAKSGGSLDRIELVGFVCATALPVLMHAVTAGIYAFVSDQRIWVAFVASWVIHSTFNWTVGHFGLSVPLAIIQTGVLTILLVAALRQLQRPIMQAAE